MKTYLVVLTIGLVLGLAFINGSLRTAQSRQASQIDAHGVMLGRLTLALNDRLMETSNAVFWVFTAKEGAMYDRLTEERARRMLQGRDLEKLLELVTNDGHARLLELSNRLDFLERDSALTVTNAADGFAKVKVRLDEHEWALLKSLGLIERLQANLGVALQHLALTNAPTQ